MIADEPKRVALGEGAARAAPTAPHATPPAPERSLAARHLRSGPERFWAKGSVRAGLAVGLALSVIAHALVMPFRVPSGLKVEDVEGEAAIPIDLLQQDPVAEPPPPETPSAANSRGLPDDETAQAASGHPKARPDAGARPEHDAGETDAQDGGPADAAAMNDAASSPADAAIAAADDAALGAPRDPHAVTGAVAAIQPNVVNVVLVIDAEVIRRNPVGATMGYLLRGIPQWDDFMSGTAIDPVRDTDWFMVSGPSLVNTERDVVLIHYSAPDAAIDRAVAIISHKYGRGGPFDVGLPGVKAVLAHADRAERVILRPAAHLLAVVPPADAPKVARQLAGSRVKAPILPGEAVYMRLVNPHRPLPELPDAITELRLRVVPRSDDGADVFVEGDTPDMTSAVSAADAVARIVRRHNDMITSLLTHGLFDHVQVSADGNLVKAHLTATRDHLETLVALVASLLGVAPPNGLAPPGRVVPPGDPIAPPSRRGTPGVPPGIH